MSNLRPHCGLAVASIILKHSKTVGFLPLPSGYLNTVFTWQKQSKNILQFGFLGTAVLNFWSADEQSFSVKLLSSKNCLLIFPRFFSFHFFLFFLYFESLQLHPFVCVFHSSFWNAIWSLLPSTDKLLPSGGHAWGTPTESVAAASVALRQHVGAAVGGLWTGGEVSTSSSSSSSSSSGVNSTSQRFQVDQVRLVCCFISLYLPVTPFRLDHGNFSWFNFSWESNWTCGQCGARSHDLVHAVFRGKRCIEVVQCLVNSALCVCPRARETYAKCA